MTKSERIGGTFHEKHGIQENAENRATAMSRGYSLFSK
jgi:hypothetical protein